MGEKIRTHRDLKVYKSAFEAADHIFRASKCFPKEEIYSLTDQIRRSSRSVCANLAEAWRKRRYKAAFIAKISDAESEAAETQVWLEFAVKCGYIDRATAASLYEAYDQMIGTLVNMINHTEVWVIGTIPKLTGSPCPIRALSPCRLFPLSACLLVSNAFLSTSC